MHSDIFYKMWYVISYGKLWNLLVLRISKLSLLLIFGQVEAEITDVKDTRGHYQFSHFQITLIDFLSNFSIEFLKIYFFSIFSSAHFGRTLESTLSVTVVMLWWPLLNWDICLNIFVLIVQIFLSKIVQIFLSKIVQIFL